MFSLTRFRIVGTTVVALALVLGTVVGAAPADAATVPAAVKLHHLKATPTPKIAVAPRVALRMKVSAGHWKPAPVKLTYQWRRNGHAITHATHATYLPTAADLGKKLSVAVTGKRKGYATKTRVSASTHPVGHQQFMTKGGLFGVNTKLHANTYVAPNATPACYWQRIAASPNPFGSITAEEFLKGQVIATVDPTDIAFKTGGCGPWMKLSDLTTHVLTTIPSSGVYLVGKQVKPGIYTAAHPGAGCNWNTVRSFSGVYSSDVINHGTPTAPGAVTATVTADSVGFMVEFCGTWVRTGDLPAPAQN
jgi:hypothetical protein